MVREGEGRVRESGEGGRGKGERECGEGGGGKGERCGEGGEGREG